MLGGGSEAPIGLFQDLDRAKLACLISIWRLWLWYQRNFQVFMKQCPDSFDDYKFPLTANKTLDDCCYYVVTIDACGRVQILQTQKKLFLLQAVRCFLGVQ